MIAPEIDPFRDDKTRLSAMSTKEKKRIEQANKWREQFDYLDILAPYERNAFSKSLIYGRGSSEHIEAVVAMEEAREELLKAIAQSGKMPKPIITWIQSALRKMAGLLDGA